MNQQQQQQQQQRQEIPFNLESGGLPAFVDMGKGKISKTNAVIALGIASASCGLGVLLGKETNQMQLRSAQQQVIIQKGKTAEFKQQIDNFCQSADRTDKN
jgi:hypothetical protein